MKLYTAHRILIAAAILMGVAMGAWGVYDYRADGTPASLVTASGGLVLVVGGLLYRRWFLRNVS